VTGKTRRALAFAAPLALATCISAGARGAAGDVDLKVSPLLGVEAPSEHGWQAYVVRLRGSAAKPVRGTVELGDGAGGTTRAPFAVGPGEQVTLELYGHDSFGKGLTVIARGESGEVLALYRVGSSRSDGPLLLDLGRTGRLEVALRGERLAAHRALHAWAAGTPLDLVVTHVEVDARSGEPVLPERGLVYDNATVVLVRSDALIAMPESRARALFDWIVAGGSLAVSVAAPGDLEHARLVELFGGPVSLETATALAQPASFEIAEPDNAPAVAASASVAVRVAPGEQVAAKLTAVKGGGLTPSRWGSSHAYGLGEVHALAFDPTASDSVDDPWVRRSMVELVRTAWDRRAPIAVAGEAAFDEGHTETARRTLDPNEGSRWTIWVSAIVLVLYALLAGPLSFRRAARRGTPLRAFVELPLWSFGAAILIVLAGAIAKGGRSRARRLSFMEVAAGERRAAILRFRALFASSAGSLGVKALDPSSLLDVAGRAPDVTRTLSLGRRTAELVDMHGRPWETVLVREDGYIDLDGAVRFVDAGGDVRIENGLGRDLVGVVARAGGGDLRYFARIPHGTITALSAGDRKSVV